MAEDDDECNFGGAFEDGHWEWDETVEGLVFMSDLPAQFVDSNAPVPKKAPAPSGAAVEFRDDVDLIEQIRFRRRYQRKIKIGQPEVISLQDIKDIALFTAPVSLLSRMLINLLHLPTTERFLRALILSCQYYLQISEEMINRTLELEYKVRTPFCDILESEFRENICDLRVLVAKEYCTMLIGGSDMKKYHHMGAQKKRRSLSEKDSRLFEAFLRITVHIVWLALGRRSFNQIELEVNRLFKSEIFNTVEHTLQTGYISKMSREEQYVLLGTCLRHDKKLTTRSPLLNEAFCHRPMDYRLTGLGVIKYDVLTPRLRYMEQAISAPEDCFNKYKVTCGILGMRRAAFDTMLHPIRITGGGGKNSTTSSRPNSTMLGGGSSMRESKKSTMAVKIFPDIVLPAKSDTEDYFSDNFPDTPETKTPCNEVQRKRWQMRLIRLLNPTIARKSNYSVSIDKQ